MSDCPLTDLEPGDIITAYVKGVHEVTRIERRFHKESELNHFNPGLAGKKPGDECSPLIHYRRRLNSNGSKAPNAEHCCDAQFCKKVTRETIDAAYEKVMNEATKLKRETEALAGLN